MRNITITRRKTYVGCAMADKIYVRDAVNPEITINGVPCRKVGAVKNGKSVTLQLGDEEQQIFLIADKLSKDYCNASITVPAGTEDVEYTGKHHFVFGSNPFRFDGQELTAQQKKQNKKSVVITVCGIVLGVIIGTVFSSILFDTVSPKTFTTGDHSVTLTSEFIKVNNEGFYASYGSASAYVFVIREPRTDFPEDLQDIDLAQYTQLVADTNGTDLQVHQKNGLYCFDYLATPETDEYYYFAVCHQSGDTFWTTCFATPSENMETYLPTFLEWAQTIQVK